MKSTIIPKNIAERLQNTRLHADLSRRTLSALAGLSESHVRLIEAGERSAPHPDTLDSLAQVMGLTLDWFIAGRGAPPTFESVRSSVARFCSSIIADPDANELRRYTATRTLQRYGVLPSARSASVRTNAARTRVDRTGDYTQVAAG